MHVPGRRNEYHCIVAYLSFRCAAWPGPGDAVNTLSQSSFKFLSDNRRSSGKGMAEKIEF